MSDLFPNEEYGQMLLERIEMLNDELRRMKEFIIDASNGYDFESTWDVDVYQEETHERKESYHRLETSMNHLLKLAYSTANRSHNEWRKTAMRSIEAIQYNAITPKGKPSPSLISYLDENLDRAYAKAIKSYDSATKIYPDLIPNRDNIPDKCPWSVEDFFDVYPELVHELILKLPEPKHFDVHMQLYPTICVYLKGTELSSKIIERTCDQCNHHDECYEAYKKLKKGDAENE